MGINASDPQDFFKCQYVNNPLMISSGNGCEVACTADCLGFVPPTMVSYHRLSGVHLFDEKLALTYRCNEKFQNLGGAGPRTSWHGICCRCDSTAKEQEAYSREISPKSKGLTDAKPNNPAIVRASLPQGPFLTALRDIHRILSRASHVDFDMQSVEISFRLFQAQLKSIRMQIVH